MQSSYSSLSSPTFPILWRETKIGGKHPWTKRIASNPEDSLSLGGTSLLLGQMINFQGCFESLLKCLFRGKWFNTPLTQSPYVFRCFKGILILILSQQRGTLFKGNLIDLKGISREILLILMELYGNIALQLFPCTGLGQVGKILGEFFVSRVEFQGEPSRRGFPDFL